MTETPHIITRKEAKAARLPRYTGKPCRFGHDGLRYTNNSHCVVCEYVITAIYREKNRDRLRQKNKKYRSDNHTKIVARHREYRIQNIAIVLEKARLYRIANRGAINARGKLYRLRKKQEKQQKVARLLELQTLRTKQKAKSIAPPDWGSLPHDTDTTLQRAEIYRDIYRAKKNSLSI